MAAFEDMKRQDKDAKAFADPPTADSYAQAVDWLRRQSAEHTFDAEKQAALEQRFDEAVQAESKERTNAAKEEFSSIADLYGEAKKQLVPRPYPKIGGADWFGWEKGSYFPGSHFFGLLATATLLTLGAPFWFNLLASLANLRSTVADRIDEEKKQQSSTSKP